VSGIVSVTPKTLPLPMLEINIPCGGFWAATRLIITTKRQKRLEFGMIGQNQNLSNHYNFSLWKVIPEISLQFFLELWKK
jgi:hypothetical protein